MAGGQERILKRRIKSVEATKKITRAMELIAGSRIVKAQQRVRAARPYSERVTGVIQNLAAAGAASDHPLLADPTDVTKIGYIVISADRGLAGGYNGNVLRLVERCVKEDVAAGTDYALITAGKKGTAYFRFREYGIHSHFEGFSDAPTYEDARVMASEATDLFESGEVQQIKLVYTQFLSLGVQQAVVVPFVPLDRTQLEETEATGPKPLYEFEPDPTTILERLLPRYAEARLFSAMLESAASEHAARQRAMKAATDNAEDLVTTLSRVMNRGRQDAITTEIMEIVGGAEALKSDGKLVSDDLLADSIEGRREKIYASLVQPHATD
ncbi:MAG: F0F1 ATP synthase subunit gamma [Acidimicrobiales bacterium]